MVLRVGVVGCGQWGQNYLRVLTELDETELVAACDSRPEMLEKVATRYPSARITGQLDELLAVDDFEAVVVAVEAGSHFPVVSAALRAGKHVFVEKPLAIREEELAEVAQEVSRRPGQILMVGFNRRFAPLARALRAFFDGQREPLVVHYRVNAGYVPPNHWTQDRTQGGGRIVGEVCHFVDFIDWLVGAVPVSLNAESLPNCGRYKEDNVVLQLRYPGGHIGVVTYVANGDRQFGKERVEVHGAGRSAVLDDFRRVELVEGGRRTVRRSWLRQDKGHREELGAFVKAARGEQNVPIPFGEILAATRVTLQAVEQLKAPIAAVQNSASAEIPDSQHTTDS